MSDLIFSVFPSENFVDLGLFQSGKEQCKPSYAFGPASRTHFLFHYVLSGKGTLTVDKGNGKSQTFHINSMQGFMIFPDQITTYTADSELPWEYCWLEFDGLKVKAFLESSGITPDSPVYHARLKDLRESMRDEMLYIINHAKESSFHVIGHLYLFFDYLVRSSAGLQITSGSRLRDFYIHEALEFIEHNFQYNITVESIAENCGLNRSYFGKIFKVATGKTPQEFLLKYRMAKASELLMLTELSIADISLAVGYDNPLHFSRAFKNIYGTSPREWRNKNKIVKQ